MDLGKLDEQLGDERFGELADLWVRQRDLLSNFDAHLVARFGHYLGERLLEVGCGTGNMTRLLLNRSLVVAIDANPENVRCARDRLGSHHNLVCLNLDITDRGRHFRHLGLDSALCANVLEHIADDERALRQLAAALPVGATLVVVVPAEPHLYCSLDVAAGHFRRYTRSELQSKLSRAGFTKHRFYRLNTMGMVGWLLNGKLAQRSMVPDWQLRLFNLIVQPLMAMESKLTLNTGLSLVAVCQRGSDEVEEWRP